MSDHLENIQRATLNNLEVRKEHLKELLEKEVELKIEIAEDVQWLKDYDKMRGQSINKEIRELLIDSITGECSSCKHWIDTQKACKLDCPLDDKWELADKTIDELINKIMAIVAEEKERI